MNTEEIILDWLQSPDNRNKLKTLEVSNSTFDAFKVYGIVFYFNGDTVYSLGNNYYRLIKKENEASRRETDY